MNRKEKNMIIAKNIRRVRKIRGLSQDELAKKVDLTMAAIGNYERGERYIPGSVLVSICQALNVPEQIILMSTDLKDNDIATNNADQLLQKIVDDNAWQEMQVGKQTQTIELLNNLLKDYYLNFVKTDDVDVKEKISAILSGNLRDMTKRYDQNFDLLHSTALFFLNYLLSQQLKKEGASNLKDNDFAQKADMLLSNNGLF